MVRQLSECKQLNIRDMKRTMYLLAVLVMIAVGCKDGKKSDKASDKKGATVSLGLSTGQIGEILTLTDRKSFWNYAGDTIYRLFEAPLAGVTQNEATLNIIHTDRLDFDKNPLLQKHHSILNIEYDSLATEPRLLITDDVWASPQIVFTIKAKNPKDVVDILKKSNILMIDRYKSNQFKKILASFSKQTDKKLEALIATKFGFTMTIPSGFFVGENNKDFLWLRQTLSIRKQDRDLGVMIYTLPYQDTAAFNVERLLNLRDYFTKQYISSSADSSYMKVDRVNIPVESRRTRNFAGTKFAVEMRGIWYMENDFMGGAFVNYSFISPDNKNIICVDGFVYNPGGDKRNYIYQLEAMFSTIKFVENKSTVVNQ